MSNHKKTTWVSEKLYKSYRQSFLAEETILNKRSSFQKVQIIKSESHGKVLLLDDIVQLTEKDEYIYHEMITHVPLLSHPNPKKILVIGGGDGGVLQRVLMHPVDSVTLVEIDELVVSASKKYLSKISNQAFKDKRLKLLIEDGDKFLRNSTDTFDVIITDRGDDIGPGQVLYEKEFYISCKKRLSSNGIMVSMTGVPHMQPETIRNTSKILDSVFKFSDFYQAVVPTYIGGPLAISFSSDKIDPLKINRKKLIAGFKRLKTIHYNPDLHLSAFIWPEDAKRLFVNKSK